MFRRLTAAFCFCLCAALPAWCDVRDFQCKSGGNINGKEAESLLSHVQDAYKQISSIRADFVQDSFLSALEISEVSSGEVWFLKPGQMKWLYKKPEKQTFTVKDETLWLYQEADKQLVIDRFSKMLISDLPVAFLLGIGDLSKSFKIISACKNLSGNGVYFNMAPQSKSSAKADQGLKTFELVVDNKRFLPAGARVNDLGSNVNTIYLEDLKTDEQIPDEVFSTQFPTGTDIDDRRKGVN